MNYEGEPEGVTRRGGENKEDNQEDGGEEGEEVSENQDQENDESCDKNHFMDFVLQLESVANKDDKKND